MTGQRLTILQSGGRSLKCCLGNRFLKNVEVAASLLASCAVMPRLREYSPSPFNPRPARVILLLSVVLIFALGVPSLAAAEGNHRGPAVHGATSAHGRQYKLDDELTRRAARFAAGTSRVIVTLQPGAQLPFEFRRFAHSGKLGIINGHVIDVPNRVLQQLAAHPAVFRVHYDRPTQGANYRTSLTVGSRAVQQVLGFDGAGIGVAVIDSGIAFH